MPTGVYKRKNSIAQLTREAVLTYPGATFTTNTILRELQEQYPELNIQTARIYITKDMQQEGLIRKTGKRMGHGFVYERVPAEDQVRKVEVPKPVVQEAQPVQEEQRDEYSYIEVARGLVALINQLNADIVKLQNQNKDLQVKLQKSDDDWKVIVREKEKTIADLNQKIIYMNRRIQNGDKTFSLSEIARFTNLGAKG